MCADHRSVVGAIIYFQGQIQKKHYDDVFTAEAREEKRKEDIGCKVKKPEAYEIHDDWYRCVKNRAKPA
jgi:hypothetical protein